MNTKGRRHHFEGDSISQVEFCVTRKYGISFRSFYQLVDHSLGSGSLEHFRPHVWLEELRGKLRGELGVGESRRVILQHEGDVGGVQRTLPVPPEPLAAESRHRKHPPVHEQPEFDLVVPFRQRSGVQALPVGLVRLSSDQNAANCAKNQS